ncbi:hypothetical protein ThidrDRAFT_1931 [Thiorhodococcus drewsii AZ1]|uniref:Uncharacterized protein n=1 Tax=Thiorhodococcus drewsii AZ1 TaxID=765913 RepID=G2E0V8_9GAMM|nr:hypothetical protein [Thiorhodococcus drewsii]EGV31730.1 hypothetical protein ThidrDRAFT_1931 [Thiorhodococcus drewsii AZ1]
MTDPALTDARISGLLRTLATADPDFDAFAQRYASLAAQPIPEDQAAALSRELLDVLRESPEQGERIDALAQTADPQRFDGGLVSSVPVLVAITFLLRTHIRFKRHADGTWELEIEHKPADSKLLTQLLQKLSSLLPGGEG